jgi:starch phosphorylase
MNLRWSWHPETTDLFASVDPALWAAVGSDPVRLLGEVPARRLDELANDPGFLSRLHAVHDDLARYLTEPRWYQSLPETPRGIGYFSPEFGITEVLPQYSGGLGILAGDHLKAASDLGVPILGVGLLYRAGYFTQALSSDGWQEEHYPALDPHGMPLALLRDAAGLPLQIGIELPEGRVLHAQIWKAQVGRVPLLLLDSDIEANAPGERLVTDRLYGGGAEHRLLQELLLGIGGVRAIRAYCALTGEPAPEVFHTNEGHAGFLGLERIRELVSGEGLSFDEALQAVRAGTVFTTHTPVPAGIDRFQRSLVERTFSTRGLVDGLPVDRVLALGAEEDAGVFNMAHMGLRLGQRANGVSKLHGAVSRGMFASLWPGFGSDEVPISSVTNGVHAPTWVAREIFALAARTVDPEPSDEARGWEAAEKIPADELWAVRRVLRSQLVGEVRRRVRASMQHRGHADAELGWVENVFDPDVLTVGFARRVPSYKRLTLMLRDPARLRALLLDPERPIQLVIAGKSHPADDGGKALIQEMVRFADDPAVRHRIVFLPDYDIGMARYLYAGCDVWLNNPLRPLEACGTSGMKAALNGGLNLSILDGWWDEMFDGGNGWSIPTADGVIDPDRRDDIEAAAFYDLVETQVRTRFYDRGFDGVPARWVDMVRHTLRSLGPQVLASRMVRDYVERLYAPAAVSAAELSAGHFAGARGLAAWRRAIDAGWSSVHVDHVEASGAGDTPELGASLHLRAEIALGTLRPEEVRVQACYGRVDESDTLQDVQSADMAYLGNADGTYRFEAQVPLYRPGAFGYTVRVLPHHVLLSSDAEPGLVVLP